jgi:hypothetical protein
MAAAGETSKNDALALTLIRHPERFESATVTSLQKGLNLPQLFSREAALECSPRRKPWVGSGM